MTRRSIKVKVEKQNPTKVTIRFLSSNSQMPVPIEEFEKRVKDGSYEVVE